MLIPIAKLTPTVQLPYIIHSHKTTTIMYM